MILSTCKIVVLLVIILLWKNYFIESFTTRGYGYKHIFHHDENGHIIKLRQIERSTQIQWSTSTSLAAKSRRAKGGRGFSRKTLEETVATSSELPITKGQDGNEDVDEAGYNGAVNDSQKNNYGHDSSSITTEEGATDAEVSDNSMYTNLNGICYIMK